MELRQPNEFDTVPAEVERDYAYAGLCFDEAFLLAQQVAKDADSGVDAHEISAEMMPTLMYLEQELKAMPHMRYRVQGEGFGIMQVEGRSCTTFASIPEAYGAFDKFYLFGGDDNDYYSKEQILEDIGGVDLVEDGAVMAELPEKIQEILQLMRKPSDNLRLYADFLQRTDTTPDQPIGGIAFRSGNTTQHVILDMTSMVLDMAYPVEARTAYAEYDEESSVHSKINEHSMRIRQLVRSTTFRRMKLLQQKRTLEGFVTEANDDVALSDYGAYFETPVVCVLGVSEDGLRNIKQYSALSAEGYAFDGKILPLRLDSLELYTVSNGHRITSDRDLLMPDAGICIVGESYDLYMPDGDTPKIVWLPISKYYETEVTFYLRQKVD